MARFVLSLKCFLPGEFDEGLLGNICLCTDPFKAMNFFFFGKMKAMNITRFLL